ncbi:MAG: phosphotyrosine protein phosphatase, partial [Phycisphaeraceae bacterium]
MNMLFICSKNQWRSPTAEQIYRSDPRLNVRSAGTSSSARHKVTP